MKLVGMIGTAVLSLTLGAAAPAYAQEQHDQQEEQKDKPAREKAQPEKPAKPEEKTCGAGREERQAGREERKASKRRPSRRRTAAGAQRSRQPVARIPADSYKANFGQRTHVSCQPGRLQQSPLPIRRLFVRIRWRVAKQLALHARRLCRRHQRRVLPVQPDRIPALTSNSVSHCSQFARCRLRTQPA